MPAKSILIASPVNKDVEILKAFLRSLEDLETKDYQISYCFVDDNDDSISSSALQAFVERSPAAMLLETEGLYKNMDWEKTDHFWSKQKIEKLVFVKEKIIKYFLDGDFSHLFLVDADLVLHPKTLIELVESNKDIIANIFWTKWQENSQELPQVWLKDFYTLYDDNMMIRKTLEQTQEETARFLYKLRQPGIYRVGGLGACTLISGKVLEAGVNFNPIYNLSFWGEDRSFCVRAAVLGFELYVNTVYPAHHIYRMADLDRIPNWYRRPD